MGRWVDAIIRAFDWVDVVVKGEAETIRPAAVPLLLSDRESRSPPWCGDSSSDRAVQIRSRAGSSGGHGRGRGPRLFGVFLPPGRKRIGSGSPADLASLLRRAADAGRGRSTFAPSAVRTARRWHFAACPPHGGCAPAGVVKTLQVAPLSRLDDIIDPNFLRQCWPISRESASTSTCSMKSNPTFNIRIYARLAPPAFGNTARHRSLSTPISN